ncbi:MAG: ABC transporter substrate-binding protein [Acidimicrobiales bacterium]|nr:ABC transporter substrate-binding protein [Acidimicrobiales bacterium]
MKRTTCAALVAAGLLAVVPVGCSKDDDGGPAAQASPVALAASAPGGLKIGIVRTTGSELASAAAGARVAEYRLEQLAASSDAITLVPRDDQGSAEGAEAAVDGLAEAGVAGIVYVADGEQLPAAVEAADAAGIPILLPYASDPAVVDGAEGAWITGMTAGTAAEAINAYVRTSDVGAAALVAGEDPGVAEVQTFEDATVLPSPTSPQALRSIVSGEPVGDAEVVAAWAPGKELADVVAALQQSNRSVPVFGGPSMLRPSFGDELTALQSASGAVAIDAPLYSVSPLTAELRGTAAGSAFVEAIRLASVNPKVEDVAGGDPLGEDAALGSLDPGAHDAVLLLEAAAAKAGSNDPKAVREALGQLDAGDVAGLAGPSLDLGDRAGIPLEAVVVVQADSQTRGPRAGIATPPLFTWYRAPQATQQ